MEKHGKHLIPLLYSGLFLVGLSMRLYRLGQFPLTDYESAWAWQALTIARRSPVGMGAQTGYVGLTALSFFLLEASRFVARLWPAILGSLMVLLPILWREKLGKWAALGLAFFLAIDPVLLVASRQVGSLMIALVGLLLGLSLLFRRKEELAGISLGMALLGGESFWLGALMVGFTLGLTKVLKAQSLLENPEGSQDSPVKPDAWQPSWRLPAFFAGTVLIVGSSFGLYPAGLSGLMAGLLDFVKRFYQPSGVNFWQLLLALLAYQFLPLFFGLWSGVRAWCKPDQLGRFLGLWFLAGMALILVSTGRQVLDLIWVSVPLWILAVRHITSLIKFPEQDRLVQVGVSLFTVIMIIYAGMRLRSLVDPAIIPANTSQYWITLGVGLILLLLVLILIALGWHVEVSRLGFLMGFCLVLLMGMLSCGINIIADDNALIASQLIRGRPIPLQDLMVDTLKEIANLHASEPYAVEVVVVGMPTEDLIWSLRDFDKASFLNQMPTGRQPEFVLTSVVETPQLSASYRGQELLWYRWPVWNRMTLVEIGRWLINKQVTYDETRLLLWARTDIFPGSR